MRTKNYTPCYIAFLDILGFKEKIKHSTCKEMLAVFDNMKNSITAGYIGDENGKAAAISAFKKIRTKVMSDSICFYIEQSVPDALFALVACCSFFQCKLLKMDSPLLVRGGIVAGELYANGDKTFGTGLTDAYLLEEKSANLPRIIMTSKTLELGKSNVSRPILAKRIEEMLYSDFDEFLVVNYYKTLKNIFANDNNSVDKILEYIDEKLSDERECSIREKYLYVKRTLLA